MRFRVKDLLLASALLSVYFAAFMYILKVTGGTPGESKSETLIFTATLFCLSIISSFIHRWRNIKKAKPIVCELQVLFPWASMIVDSAFLLILCSLMLLLGDRSGAYLPLAFSITFIAFVLHPILFSQALVSHLGIIYNSSLIPWDKVTANYDSNGTLQKIRTGRFKWSTQILVPVELADVIQDIVAENTETQS